jgi:3-hydroxyisobutyrate dehydrogenase
MDIFADTSGGPNVLKGRGPMIAAALQGRDTGPVTSDVNLARKDLQTMIEEAKSLGVGLPVSARALECYEEDAREGRASKDISTVPAVLFTKTRGTSRR